VGSGVMRVGLKFAWILLELAKQTNLTPSSRTVAAFCATPHNF
jgi:hypothetical protein